MARRMGFSVIGLPHYTIWHLYEPSVDDLKHMEDMQEQRENEEREVAKQKERSDRFFQDPKAQWEVDGAAIRDAVLKEQQAAKDVEAPKAAKKGPEVEAGKKSAGGAPAKQEKQ